MEVVAEGVETEDEAQALRALGCHTMQGFHFPKPLVQMTSSHFAKRALMLEVSA